MGMGWLITCVPSKKKKPKKDAEGTQKVRLLHTPSAAKNFVKTYMDKNDPEPSITVEVFNANGYPERTVTDKDALQEFCKD